MSTEANIASNAEYVIPGTEAEHKFSFGHLKHCVGLIQPLWIRPRHQRLQVWSCGATDWEGAEWVKGGGTVKEDRMVNGGWKGRWDGRWKLEKKVGW